MVRKSTLALAGVTCLAGAFAGAGCIGDGAPPLREQAALGQVGLELRLPDGSEVSSVAYTITRSGLAPRAGTIPVSSAGHARAQIGNLSPGTGYTIELNAQRGSAPACIGSKTFAIAVDQTTDVQVFLQCGSLGRAGNVAVDGAFNYCPSVPAIAAAPTTLAVGQPVALSAEALDEDPVSFAWSAPSGTFSAPSQPDTTFTCGAAGAVTVTVSVSDSQGCTGVTGTVVIQCTTSSATTLAPAPATAPALSSVQPAYLVPIAPGVTARAILTAGESRNNKPGGTQPYRMVGRPDGLGAFDNNDGTFTILSTHELGNTSGVARAHGGTGAFVSRWTVRKSDLSVLRGEDLIQTVNLWNTPNAAYVTTPNVAFARFSSADLPSVSALYDAASAMGFNGRLFLTGEETGAEGRAFAHGLDGVSYELPRLGKASWENIVPNPVAQPKTIVVALDSTMPGQLYVYVGNKTASGTNIQRAGLSNGRLFGVVATGFPTEPPTGIPTASFTLFALGNVENTTGEMLEITSTASDVTRFNGPEDGAWDPGNPRDFYFVTTNDVTSPSRLWRLRFSDILEPELGGTLEMLLDGSEGQVMFDNLGMDARGHILIAEDPGNNARRARIWRYTIASDTLVAIAEHSPALFTAGGAGFLTEDEEASGVIDATSLLGPGFWLVSDQVHLTNGVPVEVVEGGQYTALYDPGTR